MATAPKLTSSAAPRSGAGLAPLRALLTGVGLIAAGVLVWFVGPLATIAGLAPLAEETPRRAAIAALVIGVAGYGAWRTARAGRRNRRLMEGLVAARDATPGAQEVALLGKRFADAVALLRNARLGSRRPLLGALAGRPYVYELPWYVIIGAPGAGKTTALVNSGLEFPLAARVGTKVVRGIGGTRNCDWWFASEAVLIDTAGRYTTHESDREADRAAWLGFLGLLARYRPRRPINGVLLTLSVGDLLTAGAPVRLAHARELRKRIDELHAHLGIRFPIYVLVTKTDLLAGFMEFFADFDKDERAQVWGVTFPHAGDIARDDPVRLLASDFAALEKRLNECLIERLQAEPDRERRGAIYAFPQQWQVLRETLLETLQAAFPPSADTSQPLLRGVYFTSATQEGTPMDRALGGIARTLGLANRVVAPARPSGKTFFVTRLLRDVVFAEAGLAGTNLRWDRRRARLEWGLVGVAACAVLGVAVLSWRAYTDNRAYVAAVGAQLPALERHVASATASETTDLAALVPALDALETLAGSGAAAAAPAVPHLGLGLDQRARLAAATHDAYRRVLTEAFLPRIAARLEQRLRSGGQDHVELIYESLRAYLMLFAGKNFDRPALRGYLGADWDATLPPAVSAAERGALRRHLDRLLDGGEVGAPSHADPRLIAEARGLVAGVPLAERAYSRLKQLDLGPDAATFSVESAGGAAARRLFVRAGGQPHEQVVPALYSRAVFKRSFHERTREVLNQFAIEQDWVLGAGAGAGQASSQQAVAEQVERLYLADHARLWDAFIADLRLATPANVAHAADLAQALARPDSPLVALLRAVVREVSIAPELDARFAALRHFVSGEPPPVAQTQAALAALATHLVAVDDAVRRGTLPAPGDATLALAAAAQRAPEPLRGMLAEFAGASAAQVFAVLREPLARQLADEIAPACSRVIAGRYPFAREGEEVSREEFSRLFGGGGLLDAFYQRQLAPYAGAAAAADSLQPFRRAQAIRDAFFADGGRRLGVRLHFRLVELDPGIAEFTFDVDGQALRFRRDTKTAQSVQWPGPGGDGRITLQVSGGAPHLFEGPWALLRLFDRVRIEPGPASDRPHFVFDVEGRKARFEVRGATPLNPVLRAELEQFQCPKRL